MKAIQLFTTTILLFTTTILFAQVQINKPIQLTGGSGERTITNLEIPVNGTDAVNKDYVDAAVAASGGSSTPTMLSDQSPGPLHMMDAARYCRNLTEGGYTDWRMAYVSEIYDLVSADATITNDGAADYFTTINDLLSQSSYSMAIIRLTDGSAVASNEASASYPTRCVR